MEKKTYVNGQPVYEAQGDRLTYFFKNGRVKAEGRIENGQMVGKRTSADNKEDIAEWLDRHIDEPVGFGY